MNKLPISFDELEEKQEDIAITRQLSEQASERVAKSSCHRIATGEWNPAPLSPKSVSDK